MRDEELRARARAATLDPLPLERSRVLVDRMRMGTLSVERVELAAHCMHDPARIALGREPNRRQSGRSTRMIEAALSSELLGPRTGRVVVVGPTFQVLEHLKRLAKARATFVSGWPDYRTVQEHERKGHNADERVFFDHTCEEFQSFASWVQRLSRWGQEVQVRAAVTAGDAFCAVHRSGGVTRERCLSALTAARRWLDGRSAHDVHAWCDAYHLVATSTANIPRWLAAPDDETDQLAARPVEAVRSWGDLRPAGEAVVREAISSALVSWALS